MTLCEHNASVGAYVLGALDDADAVAFATHLDACQACRRDVADFQVVADTLPLAAEPVAPPAALKGRIMAIVESEAQLLRAAGAGADEIPVVRRRRWRPTWGLRPLTAATAALALLAVGVVGGLGLNGSDEPQTRTVAAQTAPAGAQASLRLSDGHARLAVANMPGPPSGRVYQVWLVREGRPPQPTHTLFTVPDDGSATVEIQEAVKDADAVWVTSEPSGGSRAPTSAPVIKAGIA